MKINVKKLLFCIGLPLVLGGISAFLQMDAMRNFEVLTKPPLTPPAIVFPIVWTILYTLMGVASFLVSESDCPLKTSALRIYGISLLFNVLWPMIFFGFKLYLFAFFWLVVLLILVFVTTLMFYSCKKAAGYLLLPYIVWLVLAGYLNIGIYLLN